MDKKMIGIIAAVVAVVVIVLVVFLGGKGASADKVEGSLDTLMSKLYEGIPDEEMPMLSNTVMTKDNMQYYLGTDEIDFVEGLASEPMMTSIAHSVVLLRVDEKADTKAIAQKIKTSVDPRKWICVEVEEQNVKVETRGDLILLVMVNENVDTIVNNFKNL